MSPLNAIPIPEQCLYFYPKAKPKSLFSGEKFTIAPSATLLGQGTLPSQLMVPQDYLMFKIIFQPGGFFRLFNTPMTLFVDYPEDSEAVLGKEISDVRDQIEQTEDFEKMVRIAESYLFQQLKQVKTDELPLDKVMQQLSWENQNLDKTEHFDHVFYILTQRLRNAFARVS